MSQTFTVRQIQLWRGGYQQPQDEAYGGPEQLYYKETAGQTFKVSDLVYLDANGTVAIATETSHKQNSAILGLARQAATGIIGNQVLVRPILPTDKFLMTGFHTTPASSASVQTMMGTIFGIYHDTAAVNYTGSGGTGGAWCVDLINTTPETGGTLARVMVTGFLLAPDSAPLAPTASTPGAYAQPAIGDLFPPLLVKFIPVSIQDGTAHQLILQG